MKDRYGKQDVELLSQLLRIKREEVKRPLTAREREELLEELDRKTGRTT